MKCERVRLTCFLYSSDCRSFRPVQQLSVHARLVLRVGLQVAEAVSDGSSAQSRLLLLTICSKKAKVTALSARWSVTREERLCASLLRRAQDEEESESQAGG